MTSEHKTSFAGYTVEQWNEGPLKNIPTTAYRLALDPDDAESWPEKLSRFVALEQANQVEALVVGAWWTEDYIDTSSVVESLVIHHQRLPHLRVLFIGDVTYEECEISWIQQSDMSPLFMAYPRLQHFGVRGAEQLSFGRVQHSSLQSFTLESGGTSANLVRQIASMEVPQLIDFELWTGSRFYGWDGTLDDLRPIIMGESFSHLKRLAICNCELANDVVKMLVTSPLFERLDELDFSLGTFDDEGAQVLLDHPTTKRLKRLNLVHHFCSDEMLTKLEALKEHGVGVEIDESADPREWGGDDDGRYVAVGE